MPPHSPTLSGLTLNLMQNLSVSSSMIEWGEDSFEGEAFSDIESVLPDNQERKDDEVAFDSGDLVVFSEKCRELNCDATLECLPENIISEMKRFSLQPGDILLLSLLDIHFEYNSEAVHRAFQAVRHSDMASINAGHLPMLRRLYAPVLSSAVRAPFEVVQEVLKQTYNVSPSHLPLRDMREPAPLRKDVGMLQQFEPFEFPAHRLGSGAFGAVYRARHRVDQTYYAVKVVNLMMKTPITENAVAKFVSDVRERIMREVDALSRLSHPNVLRYFSSWVDPPSLLHQKSTKLQAKIQVQPAARKAIMNRLAEFQTQAFSDSESDTESETSTTSYSCTSSAGTVTAGTSSPQRMARRAESRSAACSSRRSCAAGLSRSGAATRQSCEATCGISSTGSPTSTPRASPTETSSLPTSSSLATHPAQF
ncbi:Protein kinase domain [Carpediemonas membranifera]|uniref:Protein kinase domain n=1 Tax=Carpediemonas membranifera TaxID=201153 RepID=A0A8J6E362_9EUKA|nr:Protein kinase domain [Carpediemonas membranifera]|eukprot:KAG9392737.1 Protein kinase domain [Carpediemonas membranifera]